MTTPQGLIKTIIWLMTAECILGTVLEVGLRLAWDVGLDEWTATNDFRWSLYMGAALFLAGGMIFVWCYFIPDLWRRRHWSRTKRLSIGGFLLTLPYGMLVYYYALYAPSRSQESGSA